MPQPDFVHDAPRQRVVFAAGAAARIVGETERLSLTHVLAIATPGSGARLGAGIARQLGSRCIGLHAKAVIHVPKAVAAAGIEEAKRGRADGLVAVGGGAAIGLAKAIALELSLPIVAVPTTYSGSEASPIWGTSDGERKFTGRSEKVVPRTVLYDPELTLALPAPVTAASGMNAVAHCIEGLWIGERTPVSVAYACEAMRLFARYLPRAVADGGDREARAQCLVAAWLAGMVLSAGTALHHKLAHVLGGLGLPHAQTHAIVLPHVARFNLQAAPEARERLAPVFGDRDPAAVLEEFVADFPIPKRLRDLGLDEDKIGFVAEEVAKLDIRVPREAGREAVRALLEAAF